MTKLTGLTVGLCLGLAASGCSLNKNMAKTNVEATVGGQHFSWASPKDTVMTGFVVEVSKDGTARLSCDHMETRMNPTNVTAAANGQAQLIDSVHSFVIDAMKTGGETAGTLSGKAVKAAVAP